MSGATTPDRDAQLLSIGRQCSHRSCMLVDFLPFRCQHCHQAFCSDHFRPQVHECAQFDATKFDRIAPSCPLCNTPVAIPPGQDPNIRMDGHINSECSFTTGNSRKTSSPVCAKVKCGKVLFSPIKCETCKKQFCPQHRFPTSHSCASSATASGNSTPTRPSVGPSRTAAATSVAVAAIQRAVANTSTIAARPTVSRTSSGAQLSVSAKTPTLSVRSNPFSQTDRLSPFSPPINNTRIDDSPQSSSMTPPPSSPPATCKPNRLPFVPPPLFASA